MSVMPTEPFVAGEDREHRDRRLVRATVWCETIGDQDALVRDISRNGLGGRVSREPLASGMDVAVNIVGGLQVTGVVRWTRGNAFGMRFHKDLEPTIVADHLRKQLDAASSHKWEIHSRHRLLSNERELPKRWV